MLVRACWARPKRDAGEGKTGRTRGEQAGHLREKRTQASGGLLAELGLKLKREKNFVSFSFHNISKHFQMKF
jgi:hypothetical protein